MNSQTNKIKERTNMIKKFLMGLGLIVIGTFIIAALKPDEMNVAREISISATPEKLFPFLNNAKKSYEWMPWGDGDPGFEIKFSAPAKGIGLSSSWNGKEMGVSTSKVVESIPNQLVRTK